MKLKSSNRKGITSIHVNKSQSIIHCTVGIACLSYMAEIAELKTIITLSLLSYLLIKYHANRLDTLNVQTEHASIKKRSIAFFDIPHDEDLFTNMKPTNN